MKLNFYLKNPKNNEVIKLKDSDQPETFEFNEEFNHYHLWVSDSKNKKHIDFGEVRLLNYQRGSARLVEEFSDGFFRPVFSEWTAVNMKAWSQSYISSSPESDFFLFQRVLRVNAEDYTISYTITGPERVTRVPFTVLVHFESSNHSWTKPMSVNEFISTFKGTLKEQEKAMKDIINALSSQLESKIKLKR